MHRRIKSCADRNELRVDGNVATGRVQTEMVRAQTYGVVRRRERAVRRRYLVTHRRLQKLKKLWKVISLSKLVQTGHLRCFLASTRHVDAKTPQTPDSENFE